MQSARPGTAYKHHFDPLIELGNTANQDSPDFILMCYMFFPLFVWLFNGLHHPFWQYLWVSFLELGSMTGFGYSSKFCT